MIVWKIDRISRILTDFSEMYEELKQYKITFISKNEQFDTSTAMGVAMLKIILVFAELERKITVERVFAIMLSAPKKGYATVQLFLLILCGQMKFNFPSRFRRNSSRKHVFNLYEELRSTLQVAFQLNETEVKTKRGGQWTAKTVGDILRNPFYIGTYRYNMRDSEGRLKDESEWIVKENNHPAIIDIEQFHRVNQLLSDNYRRLADVQRADIHKHIFSKMIYCGECKALLTARLDTARKDGYTSFTVHLYLVCCWDATV